MKLYVFEPNGHGSRSFFIIAESEVEARDKVNVYVLKYYSNKGVLDYNALGWGTNYYSVTVVDPGEIFEVNN